LALANCRAAQTGVAQTRIQFATSLQLMAQEFRIDRGKRIGMLLLACVGMAFPVAILLLVRLYPERVKATPDDDVTWLLIFGCFWSMGIVLILYAQRMKIVLSMSGIEMRYIFHTKRFNWTDLVQVAPNAYNGDPVLIFRRPALYTGGVDRIVEMPIGHDKTLALMFWTHQWSNGNLRELIERYASINRDGLVQ
jgi:hypothetical protein